MLKTSFRTATKTGEAISRVKQSIRELTKDFVEGYKGRSRGTYLGTGAGGLQDAYEGLKSGLKNVAKKSALKKEGGLRTAAREIHEQLGDIVARTKRTVSVGEVKMPNGSVEYWASVSSNKWSSSARKLAEEKGFKINKWTPKEGEPITFGISGVGKEGNLTHAEMIILNSLPEGAKVQRFGIAWTLDKATNLPKTIPCPGKCAPIIEGLGIKID